MIAVPEHLLRRVAETLEGNRWPCDRVRESLAADLRWLLDRENLDARKIEAPLDLLALAEAVGFMPCRYE